MISGKRRERGGSEEWGKGNMIEGKGGREWQRWDNCKMQEGGGRRSEQSTLSLKALWLSTVHSIKKNHIWKRLCTFYFSVLPETMYVRKGRQRIREEGERMETSQIILTLLSPVVQSHLSITVKHSVMRVAERKSFGRRKSSVGLTLWNIKGLNSLLAYLFSFALPHLLSFFLYLIRAPPLMISLQVLRYIWLPGIFSNTNHRSMEEIFPFLPNVIL